MTAPLTVYLPESPLLTSEAAAHQTLCHYLPADGVWQSDMLASLQPGSGEAPQASARDARIVLPGYCAASTEIRVPVKQQKHLSRILPFLCEEHLATNLEEVHIAAGAIQGEQVSIAITPRQLLEQTLQLCRSAGLQPVHLTTELELLRTLTTAGESLLWLDDRNCHLVIRRQAISLHASQLDYALEQLRREPTSRLQVYQPAATEHTGLNLVLGELRANGVEVESHQLQDGDANLPRQLQRLGLLESAQHRALNQLQGRFAPPARNIGTGNWRPFAIAASALIVLNLVYLLAGGFYFKQRSNSLHSASVELYRSYFPDDRRIINMRTQTRNHLNQAGGSGDSDFMQLLQTFVTPWREARDQLKLNSLRYNQARGELLVDMEARSIEQLDKLRVGLGQQAELLSASENADGVRGRIRLQGGKP